MGHYGFGEQAFGEHPFGDVDYAKIVLWDELPPDVKADDERQGFPYKKFVEAMAPNYQWVRNHIRGFQNIVNPLKVRADLLEWFGANFGIEIDVAEPEAYQRMRASLAARWNIIKGTVDSYVVLCRVHGFEVDVVPLWWTGSSYSETVPSIFGEASTVTSTIGVGETTFTIRFGCYPIDPGSISVQFDLGTVTDDGAGSWNAPATSGTIDYGWGYATLVYPSALVNYVNSSYDSVVGGCTASCVKCKTHRLRLRITPGAIGGQDELTISEAYQRLYRKLGILTGDGVIPVHVELEQLSISGTAVISIGYRYDILEADAYTVDYGLRWLTP
jgi:hypothetical protein